MIQLLYFYHRYWLLVLLLRQRGNVENDFCGFISSNKSGIYLNASIDIVQLNFADVVVLPLSEEGGLLIIFPVLGQPAEI